jgi:hypothetical protein
MSDPHIVPLSRQAVEILKELQRFSGAGKYVFLSLLSRDRPMSENTINAALRRLGYSGDNQTGHGFRSMASTLLNEHGFPPDVIELQLAHVERNKVRATYNKAQRLAERRTMMQARGDYLDELRERAVNRRVAVAGEPKMEQGIGDHQNMKDAEFLPIDGQSGAGGESEGVIDKCAPYVERWT